MADAVLGRTGLAALSEAHRLCALSRLDVLLPHLHRGRCAGSDGGAVVLASPVRRVGRSGAAAAVRSGPAAHAGRIDGCR
jgi:hypothetical protein